VNAKLLRLIVAWLVSVAVGCTSAPVRYYTLTVPPDQALSASDNALVIDVRIVHTPRQLNRAELMVRTGPSEMTLLENERWASPVSDEIKGALRLELKRRLPRGFTHTYARLTLDIDVQRLEAELGRYALIEASWRATLSSTGERSNGAPATMCTFQANEKIQPGYAGMVEGYQREIGALADAIVAALTSHAGDSDPACQNAIEESAGGSGSKNH
jgi:uncharacterized lipoprotein YmbA